MKQKNQSSIKDHYNYYFQPIGHPQKLEEIKVYSLSLALLGFGIASMNDGFLQDFLRQIEHLPLIPLWFLGGASTESSSLSPSYVVFIGICVP